MIYLDSIISSTGLLLGSTISFKFNNGEILRGIVSASERSYYIINFRNIGLRNNIIFRKLDIICPNKFVENVVGYKTIGDWPEVKTMSDLEKVLEALLKVNKPSNTTLNVEISKKNKKEVRITIKNNKHIKLNFKL